MALPTQTQLMLPLMQILSERGEARPKDIYNELAERVDLSAEDRHQTIRCGSQEVNEFERRVRWTRQTAVFKGLIRKGDRAVWSLTEKAKAKLGNIRRGMVLTFAVGPNCTMLWANVEDALAVIEPGSVQTILSSPPYPLQRPREYGNLPADQWVDWMLRLCEQMIPYLTETGSFMFNLGPVWKPGVPAQSLYQEKFLLRMEESLGVHLLQRLDWSNPVKLAQIQWNAKHRVRVKPSVEPIFWMSPNPNAYGNNLAVLRPYSKKGLEAIRNPRLAPRPCGEKFGPTSFVDRGGSIPPSLITATPTGKSDAAYRRAMRAAGMVPHPATMPAAVARFGILLASREGDTVLDPFSGSGTVPIEAARLGRNGIGIERARTYLEGSLIRAQTAGIELLAA